jgi:hypothetical protein
VILGLDRLLARLRGRDEPEPAPARAPARRAAPPVAGAPAVDEEVGERIDAARVRLREEIPPLSDADQ